MSGPSLDDYIDVAQRIATFTEKYPDGSLQTIDWEVRDVGGQTFIVYRAAAYRTPNDKRPGHGIAWEPFPGPTNFTRNSELMNAETAAWGRAIVAVGLTANKKIASRQEVKARQAESQARQETGEVVTEADVAALKLAAKGLTFGSVKMVLTACGIPHPAQGAGAFEHVPRSKAAVLREALAEAKR